MFVLGTGRMAANHAKALAAIDGVSLTGGVEVDPVNLKDFCEAYSVPHQFGSVEAAIARGQFDAATNVTPDAMVAGLDREEHLVQ
ncbi:MAG: hypothetical protein ACYC0C_16605 [Devosia sp.]